MVLLPTLIVILSSPVRIVCVLFVFFLIATILISSEEYQDATTLKLGAMFRNMDDKLATLKLGNER